MRVGALDTRISGFIPTPRTHSYSGAPQNILIRLTQTDTLVLLVIIWDNWIVLNPHLNNQRCASSFEGWAEAQLPTIVSLYFSPCWWVFTPRFLAVCRAAPLSYRCYASQALPSRSASRRTAFTAADFPKRYPRRRQIKASFSCLADDHHCVSRNDNCRWQIPSAVASSLLKPSLSPADFSKSPPDTFYHETPAKGVLKVYTPTLKRTVPG